MAQSGQKLLKPCKHSYLPVTVTLNGGREIPGLQCKLCKDLLERRDVVSRYKKGE